MGSRQRCCCAGRGQGQHLRASWRRASHHSGPPATNQALRPSPWWPESCVSPSVQPQPLGTREEKASRPPGCHGAVAPLPHHRPVFPEAGTDALREAAPASRPCWLSRVWKAFPSRPLCVHAISRSNRFSLLFPFPGCKFRHRGKARALQRVPTPLSHATAASTACHGT